MARIQQIVGRRPARYMEMSRSDTDSGAGIWCDRLGKYVKPEGQVNGVTLEEAKYPRGVAKYIVTPAGLGSLDS